MQRRISIILIIVALVLVAGCGVYYLVKNSDSKDEITENTTKNIDVGTGFKGFK